MTSITYNLTNKVRNKETNEQMHDRNIRFGCVSNQRPRTPKANTITTVKETSLLHRC